MRALPNKYFRYIRLILVMLGLPWTMTSCIRDDMDDCFYGVYVRVVAASHNSSDPNWIGEGAIGNVMLYVFDQNQVLLDTLPTEVGKVEHLNYPNTNKLYVASAANIDSQMTFTEMVPGETTLSQVEIALKEGEKYLDFNCFTNPSDVFSGQIEFPNIDTEEVFDLPIYRRVAAVMVRVRGLKEHLDASGSSDEDYTVVFGAQYHALNFDGQTASNSLANSYPVPYKQTGGFRIAPIDNREYYEAPKHISTDKTDYFRVFSTHTGTPVSVSIYYKDQLVAGTPVTLTSAGNPIIVKNDLLNVIEIIFGKGIISIRIKEAEWNGVVEIEKDFGNESKL